MSRRALFSVLIVALTLAGAHSGLQAQTYIWTGGSESSSVGSDANWQDETGPSYNSETYTYGGPSVVLGFFAAENTRVRYSGSLSVFGLCFDDFTQGYRIQGSFNDGGSGSLYIGAGGIDYKPTGAVVTQIYDSVRPTADQTWYVGGEGRLEVYGPLMEPSEGDAFTLTKSGDGTLALYGPTNYDFFLSSASTLQLNAGQLELRTSAPTALGNATLDFNGGTLVARSADDDYESYGEDELYLGNRIISHGLISTVNEVPLFLVAGKMEVIAPIPLPGTQNTVMPSAGLTLAADTTIVSQGKPLYIESDIDEVGGARKLTIDSTSAVILTGENSHTGGTHVNKGVLIFGNIYSIPEINLDSSDAGKLSSAATGYIGFGDSDHGSNVQGYFIDTFDKANTHGAIGFDTDPDYESANIFYGDINLTGFASDARLGSATRAILTGTITPQGTDYRFGGGGGFLQVASAFVDVGGNSAIVVDSPVQTPLTLRIAAPSVMLDTMPPGTENTAPAGNSFSGGLYVTHSAVVFAHETLPTQITANNWSMGTGGYIGYEGVNYDDDTSSSTQTERINDFIARFNPAATTGIIGFDANPDEWGSGHTNGDIDLSGFSTGGIYLGTSTPGYQDGSWYAGVVLNGAITTANGGTAAYRFAGYKGGMLEVNSPLTGPAGVVIGDPNAPETFGDFIEGEYSTVALTGDNAALTGNVTFYGGRLLVGQENGEIGYDPTSALGTGTLIIAPFPFPSDLPLSDGEIPPALLASYRAYDDLVIANDIQLNADLGIGGYNNERMIAFTGVVSGAGGLEVGEDGDIRLELHSANTFTGGVYVRDNSALDLYDDHASGTGMISFGSDGSSSGDLYFNTANPVIGGLASKELIEVNFLESFATLTINQASDSVFSGEFRTGTESDALRIVKTGAGTLRLDDGGLFFHNGVTDDYIPPDAIPPPGAQAGTMPSPEISLEVRQGTLVLGDDFYIEDSSPTFRVTGHVDATNPANSYAGTLQVDDGKSIYNPIIVENGGRLAGNGNFTSGISISDGAIIAPGGTGAQAISLLHFDHLELGGLGIYEWQVNGLPGSGDSVNDVIRVYGSGTLIINATAESPFTIRVISLNSGGDGGVLTGIDQSHGMYVWTLFNYDYLGESGFDPNAFVIDTGAFSSDATLGGSFTIFQENNQILLGFTPVPEPSTYALMALGLGFVIWSLRRRRA